MREYRFRGRVEKNHWVYGSLLQLNDQAQIFNTRGNYVVDPLTVGQFTGLRDINGHEIYEGDILDSKYFENLNTHKNDPCYVAWSDDGWDCTTSYGEGCTLCTAVSYGAKIIGNIHDNDGNRPKIVPNMHGQ